jgi:hypothetical protein
MACVSLSKASRAIPQNGSISLKNVATISVTVKAAVADSPERRDAGPLQGGNERPGRRDEAAGMAAADA